MSRSNPALARADVAVIGAGLAGLVVARDVSRSGLTPIVLEARDRVGGRIWNREIPGGEVVEAGGQWIGPTQDRIAALAAEQEVDTFETYRTGKSRLSINGGSDLPAEVAEVLGDLEQMARELPVDAPWLAEHAREWDAQTAHTWLQGRVQDPGAMALLRLFVASVFTAEPDELSLLHMLVYIRSAGSLDLLTRIRGGAQERRFVGGSQLIATRLARQLGEGCVRLSHPVRRIRQDSTGVVVEADGLSVEALRAIVTVPIAMADQILFEPLLPVERAQMHRRFAPGASIKINFVYEEPFWREAGLSGHVLCDRGPVTATFDNSPPSGNPGVLVGFVDADDARDFMRLSEDDRRKAAIACMTGYFGPRAGDPIGYIEMNWSAEEWTRGCFGSNLPPGAWTRYGETLRKPFGRIHWAGAETSTIWMNYMDGAVRSGERAAAEVVAALR